MKKIFFYGVLIVLLLLIPVTLLTVTPPALAFRSPASIANFIQRFFGLTLFTLLFVQLILGAFMDKIEERVGGWVFQFHVIEGVVIYSLALLHPLFFMIFNRYIGSSWNPYFVFVDICLLCKTRVDFYYSLGRISFWLLTITIFAGLFRKATPWLKANWRKLHVLNYVIFLITGLHGFFIGTDFQWQPFYSFAIIAYAIVVGVVVFIEIPRLYKNYINWVRS
jgi:predicted ferric reductase